MQAPTQQEHPYHLVHVEAGGHEAEETDDQVYEQGGDPSDDEEEGEGHGSDEDEPGAISKGRWTGRLGGVLPNFHAF